MFGKKVGIRWVFWLFLLMTILVVCVDLEEEKTSAPYYVSLSVPVLLSQEETETASDTENQQTKEEEEAKRRKNNQYFAAFVTLGAIGNSVSFYKIAKRMK